MPQAATDRLMYMCHQHADAIAELWYKALSKNERTTAFDVVPRETAIRHAVAIYKNMGNMYFAKEADEEVEHILNVEGVIEDYFARGIPLEQILYSQVLLRRHIWIKAEDEALFELALNDMYEAVHAINRILLIFDYINYITARKYRELSSKKGK
ncbi:MAG: hypothetical protein JXA46_06335 [Dehalococcoidales bacterium]|nr:hypothetical protein [Dehalococcoidales bacterium]